MILNLEGRPEASSEIVRRLKQIGPTLDLRYVRYPDPEGNQHARWALIEAWNENDPRRRMIQDGLLPPDSAFDILGYLPIDCNPNDAFGYIVGALRSDPSTRYRRHLEQVDRYNENILKEAKEEMVDLAADLASAGFSKKNKVYQPGVPTDTTDGRAKRGRPEPVPSPRKGKK